MDNGIIADPSYAIVIPPIVVVPLVYDDTVETGGFDRVLFVHSAASALQTYANATTFTIVYDYSATLEEVFALMRRKFSSPIKRVGFAFHNNSNFLNGEPWFSDSDLEESQTVFSPNTQFMLDFLREYSVVNVDFFACRTLQSEKWRKYFEVLRLKTGVIVGASENDTGNMKYGGDWVMESTMEDVRDVYFNGEVGNWAGVLATSMTVVSGLTFSAPLLAFGGSLLAPVVVGNLLFVAVGEKILKVDLATNTVSSTLVAGSAISGMCNFGDFIYYCMPRGNTSGQVGIGRLNISNGSNTALWVYALSFAASIATDGTYLYISYAYDGGMIRCPLSYSGTGDMYGYTSTTLWTSHAHSISYLYCYGSFLYKNDGVSLMRFTGSSAIRDSTFFSMVLPYVPFVIHNGYVYFTKYDGAVFSIAQYSLDGTVENDAFYSITTTDSSLIGNGITIYKNKLYCTTSDSNGKMFFIQGLPTSPVTISANPTVTAPIYYPAPLGSVLITGGTASVPGTFQIHPSISSSVYQTGTYTNVSALFTPTDSAQYSSAITSVPSITVLVGSLSLSVSGIPFTEYTPKKTVDLRSVIALSGGSPDISKIYSVVPGSGLDFTISGNFMSYPSVGRFPITISISGGKNYSNIVTLTTDISVNRAPLLLSISGTPTTKTYSASLKTIDLTTILTLSGGSDLSAAYSVSGSSIEYSISGTLFTYTNAGKFPISISMSGGFNYLNDVQIGADISINRAVMSLSVSGTPRIQTYYAANKTVDLSSAITLSGGASDVSPIYSVSGGSGNYTISGAILTYDTFGRYTVAISISGGQNYNDVRIGTDISINKAQLLTTVSGAPRISIFNPLLKTVDLTSVVSLSGSVADITPIYSVSGGSPGYTISGTTLTYTNRGLYIVAVSLSGSTNYTNNVRLRADISVNQSELTDLSISGEPGVSDYTLTNKTVDLTSVLSLSGGAPDIVPIYSVSGGTGLIFSISGSILTYKDVGIYPIIVSMSGGTNYSNNKSVKTDISINKVVLPDLTILGTPIPKEYTLGNKSFDLKSVVSLSGGAADISAIYSVSGGTGEYSISGSIFTYTNVGIWPIFVSMSGGKNYLNDVLVPTDISINQAPLLLSISGTPTTKTYSAATKTIDITSILTLSGGSDLSANYSVSGSSTEYSISGTLFTYTNAGKFPISISMSGGSNYSNDIQIGADISINKAPWSFSLSGTPRIQTYYAANKTVDLSSAITLSGGATDVSPIYSISGGTGNYSISGTILTYDTFGRYTVAISISGGQNYSSDIRIGTDISVNKGQLLTTVSGTPRLSIFDPLNKKIDLTSVVSLSGTVIDITPIYSVSGPGYTISGTTLTYIDRGLFTIAISLSGGTNYWNNIRLGADISVNQSALTDLSISGEPRVSDYTLANKTVDLTSVLSLSGGAPDIVPIYSVSGGTGLIFSISGTFLTYKDVGIYPIIVSMSGGINYSNDKFVKTDISINQIPLSFSISGTPIPKEYFLANKSFDLTTVLTLSGGAADISAIYSVSGGTGEYSISGSIFTYKNVGIWPIFVSMSGGKNYSNDVLVPVDISINKSSLLPLSISGIPLTKQYFLADKSFDLKTILSLSGGAQDISAIYSVSGGPELNYSISGSIFTYTSAGIWPIWVSMSGGTNYTNDVLVPADISINRAPLSLSVSGTPTPTPYSASTKTVDLLSVVSLSGGALDISEMYSVSGGTGDYSISGTTFTYTNAGLHQIYITLSSGINYSNNVQIVTDISINKIPLLLSVSGTPSISTYSATMKTVDLLDVIRLSGGAIDLSTNYSVSGSLLDYSVSGTTLLYKNFGNFPIYITMSGGNNYANNILVRSDISVNQSTLTELSISGDPDLTTYSASFKTVDLTGVLTLSGGAPDISAIYSVSGGTGLIFSISGSILTYVDVGTYPIIVSMSGGMNYSNDRSVKTNIRVTQPPLPDIFVLGTPVPKTYTLASKTVDLTTVITLSGGAQDISAIYSVSGSNLDYSISGSIFTYTNSGIWPIIVSMSGGTNYRNDVLVGVDISINQAPLSFSISGTPLTKEYYLADKSFDLTSILTISGGADDISAIYSVSGSNLEYSISGSIFTYTNTGIWPIFVSMSGGRNYSNDVLVPVDISINKAPLPEISISGEPIPSTYILLSKIVDLRSVLTLSGGAHDLSAIYTVSGGIGLEYSISGTFLYYKDVGIYPIAVSMMGERNYSNDVSVGTDISINQATLSDISISGEPRSSVYTLAYKTVDLRSVLTLSGGADDISACYTVSSSTDHSYSISGTFLTYIDRGTFPLIVSMSGGTNYWNNVQVPTEIVIDQSPLPPLSISGTPRLTPYNLLDKTVDLTYVLTLSGGAQDISAIYTVSSLTDSTYSISGSILTYVGTGTYPLIVSMSGGWNYSNDVQVGTVIRVVPPALPALSISGIPLPSDYTLSDKTVDLLRVLSLSGGAADISAIYSVSGSNLDYSISGTTFTYTNAGLFRIYVSMSGGLNYSNDVLVGTDISINQVKQSQISISGEPRLSTYTLANKTVDLRSVLTLSGGAPDISAIFSSGLDYYSISGTILTYENTGTYPITVSVSGGLNYWNNVLVETSITIEEAVLLPLSISGTNETSEYILLNKKVDLEKVIILAGGAADISAIYTVSGGTSMDYTISGTILSYENIGTYTISISMSGGRNYSNNVEVGTDVIITQSTLLPLSVSGTPEPSTYTLASKTVDLTKVIVLVGGAQDISAVYSVSGDTGLSYSISGTILTYDHVGIFPIWVSMSGGMNYSNNVLVGTDISINQAVLLPLSISGTNETTEYVLLNKKVDLAKVIVLVGGAADISAIYTVSGVEDYSISGTILTYENVGTYTISVSMSGGRNYSNNVEKGTDVVIVQSTLSPLSVSGTPVPSTYTLAKKTVDLRSVLTLSGGAADISAVYRVSSNDLTYSISGTILTYENVGIYPVIVSFEGGRNYSDYVEVGADISINKAVQSSLSISSNDPSTYTLYDKTVDLTSVLTLSGGAADIRNTVIYSVSGDGLGYSIAGTILTYENAGKYRISVSISGGTNYSNDVLTGADISINKDIQPALFVTPTPSTFTELDKTVDLESVLSLSGGAPDLRNTVIYSVSGGVSSYYSISGTILSYTRSGSFPIAVSISGGTNYKNSLRVGTDISINKATIPLSISGTPRSYVFDIKNKTVLLPSAISIDGGSPDSVATYSGPNVHGQILTYGNIGSYPVIVSVSGGINYTDTSAVTAIEITRATLPLSVTSISYAYDPSNKTVVLPVAISLSGGAQDVSASYSGTSVSGSSVSNGILFYGDVGSYPVDVSVSGGYNYTDTYASTSITIYKATVPLSISRTPTIYTFDFVNRNISLTSAISLSGGAPNIAPSFSGTGVNGTILTFVDAGTYPVQIAIFGEPNYTDTFTSTHIIVNKATLPLSVYGASYTFNPDPSQKNISLLSAISIVGGAQDVSACYNGLNGVNGSTLTYTDAGSYLVNVTVSGGTNYTDTAASLSIVIEKALQLPEFVLSSYSVIFDPRNNTVDLSGKGIGGLDEATKSYTGAEVFGTTLFYTDVGDYFVTATKSFPNYYDVSASYTVTIMYPNPDAGATAAELKAAGYTLSSLFAIGYTITGLLVAGYLASELKEAVLAFGGFSSTQLTTLGYTAVQLQGANYIASELKSTGFTLLRLFDLGYTTTKLLAAGYTDSELKSFVLVGGFTSEQLTALGYTALQLQNGNYTVIELRSVGYTPNQLFDLGFTSTKLLDAGYTPVELKIAVMASGNMTLRQLTSLGYTAAQLQAEEYTATELKTVGFPLSLLYVAGYTTSALFQAGYTATEIQNSVPTAGYTVPELREIGFTPSQLKPAGYFLAPLVDGGFSVQDLKDALFSPAELLTQFPAADLYKVFSTPSEQKRVTKAVVSEMFSPSNSIVTGLPVTKMVGFEFHRAVSEVTAAVITDPVLPTTFRLSDFNNGSTAIYAILDVLGSTVIMPTRNSSISIRNIDKNLYGKNLYRVVDASGAIYRDNLVAGNRVTVDGLTVIIGSVVASLTVLTVSQLIEKGLNTSVKLIDAGYDATKLELAGYGAVQLELAGFTAKQLMDVGYTAKLLDLAGYTATRLLSAGFESTDLETVGYTDTLLLAAHFSTATRLIAAGYTAAQLRLAGFTVNELKTIGYTVVQLEAAGFIINKQEKKIPYWLSTTSENVTFHDGNDIKCNATSATGETVTTIDSFKTCIVTFLRPEVAPDYSSIIEKRYVTTTLFSNVLNTETYGLTFRSRNVEGELRFLVCFELNGTVKKFDIMEDGKWNSFSMILHENDVTVCVDEMEWFKIPRKVFSGTCAYRAKFNLNHDKTEMNNITFKYFHNATNKMSYTIPALISPSSTSGGFTFTFDYLEGAIRELRDISAGSAVTLHVQNINYDLDQRNNRIPVITTLIRSSVYITRVYLSKDTTLGTGYDVEMAAPVEEGKTVIQEFRYFNVDGSGHILSDIQVYI